MSQTWTLSDLVDLHETSANGAIFQVLSRRRGGRWRFFSSQAGVAEAVFSVTPKTQSPVGIGDAPDLVNPLYLMAIIGSCPTETSLPDLQIPTINFGTDEFTRRSMTLNGMRMSTEYFATGSLRVLDLIDNRLEAGQRDVVHNVLVYLAQSVLDVQAEEREARDLRAEALAAYLGLSQRAMEHILSTPRPAVHRVVARIQAGEAGPICRKIDIEPLVENQLELLRPQLREYARREENILRLVDAIVQRLR